jgi:hypothetical protein
VVGDDAPPRCERCFNGEPPLKHQFYGTQINFLAPLDTPAQGSERGMNQNGYIHKEGAVLDIAQVVLDVLVDRKGPVGAQLP